LNSVKSAGTVIETVAAGGQFDLHRLKLATPQK
jgi:hypothetical protein